MKTNKILKNTAVIGVSAKLDYKFFLYWVEFLKPFHKINQKDSEVLASFLYKRYQLSKVILDENVLDQALMADEVKKEICAYHNISVNYFQVIMYHLRKNKAFIGNRINKKLIPLFDEDEKDFKLIFHFRFDDSN